MTTDSDSQPPDGTWRAWLAVVVAVLTVSSVMVVGVAPLTGIAASDSSTERTHVDGASADASVEGASNASIPDEPGVLSGRIELANANATVRGANETDLLGTAVAEVGDLNGDGVADVAIGAPRNDTGGQNAGAVYVFYGPVNPGELNASDANVTLYGAAPNARAGVALDGADVDGDADSELVVGAPFDDQAGRDAGAVYIFDFDEDTPANASLANATRKFLGASANDRAGRSVAGIGNASDDTPDRVLVGAPRNDSAGETAGAVYLLSNVTDSTTRNRSLTTANATFTGVAAGDRAGVAVSTAGDFDGDGDHDLLIGALGNDSTATDAGAAYVLTADEFAANQSLATANVTLAGAERGDLAGLAVSYAGDVNNDTYGDVVVGAPFNDSNGNESGVAYVVQGSESANGTMNLSEVGVALRGNAAGDRAGWSVAAAGSGDVTCDVYADVLVGAPGNNSTAPNAGAAYLVTGGETFGDDRNLSTANATFVGAGEGDRAGRAVSGLGDVTGNRTKDVIVGAPRNDSATANDTGAAYVLDGTCVPPEEAPEPTGEIVDVTCEKVTVEARNVDADAITVKVVFEDGSSTQATAKTEDGEFDGRIRYDNPEDENVTRVKLYAGHGTSGELLDDTGHIDVTCREPEPEPEGSIRDVTCEKVSVEASNVDAEAVTVKVMFEDGSSTTESVQAEDGAFDGRIRYDNPEDENVTRVKLYAGVGTSGELLDDTGQIDVTCREPEPEPAPDTVVVSEECERLEVTNPSSNDETVQFRVRYSNGTIVGTTGELAPGESQTFDALVADDYQVTAKLADEPESAFGSGSVTVNGEAQASVEVEACEDLIVVQECDDDDGEVTFVNPNDVPVKLTFNGSEYVLAANGSTGDNLTFEDLDDDEYAWSAETEYDRSVGNGTITVECDPRDDEASVVFNGCGNAVVTDSSLDYPVTVQVQVYNPGKGPKAGYRVVERQLEYSGDSVSSPGGKMVAIDVPGLGAYKNPTFEAGDRGAFCPGGQKPGEEIDEFPPYSNDDDEDEEDEEYEEDEADEEDEEGEEDEVDEDDEEDEENEDDDEDDADEEEDD